MTVPVPSRVRVLLALLAWMLSLTGIQAGEASGRGILRIARLSDPQTIDPAMMSAMEDYLLTYVLHQPLLDVTNTDQIVNNLSRDFGSTPDKRVWTFHLLPGVRFSNGRPVEAADYAFSMARFLDPAVHSPSQSYLLGIRGAKEYADGKTNVLAGVRAPDPLTLVVELDEPDSTFPYLMTTVQGMALDRSSFTDPTKDCGPSAVTTGLYLIEEWRRGARLRLRRNPQYHNPGRQMLEGIDLLIGGDEVTHLMMFERGELDIANVTGAGIPAPDLSRLRRDPRWKDRIESTPLFYTAYVNLNTEMAPFTDVRVRRAMNYAFNRTRWLGLSPGAYEPAYGVVPRSMTATFNPGLKGYDHDPERARQLLREAGFPNGFKTTLWHIADQRASRQAQSIQADLAEVGVQVELHPANATVLWDSLGNRGAAPMSISGWGVSIPDPKDCLGVLLHSRSIADAGSMNQSFYRNPVLDALLDEASRSTTESQRVKLYRQAEELVVADAPWIFQGHMKLLGLRQPWLKGPLMDPLAWYRFDRVWIER